MPGPSCPSLFFIVGVPRSGTTMVRELIGQHAGVAIPLDELQVLPRLIDTLGEDADFSDKRTVERFLETCRSSNFVYHLAKNNLAIDFDRLRSEVAGADWGSAVTALVRQCSPSSDEAVLFGEKTPYNLLEIDRFARVFPGCRFLHVIRDPRDVCVSMRKAWGKRPYRAAVRWRRYLDYYARVCERPEIARACHALRYEDLLRDPRGAMQAVCGFLGLAFEEKLLSLRRGAEKWGDAAGSKEIDARNVGKFRRALSDREVGLIESLAWPHLAEHGYEPVVATGPRSVSSLRYNTEGVSDLLGGLRAHIREKGFVAGVQYRLRQLRSR